ncbi:MAG: murein biosynthesis integral membrane protein MurJ, partial [Acidimicrobiia bacterium]|nr:murein biosynthesis integral membrane protein MurJ [Acidimicrobiia bacterium]
AQTAPAVADRLVRSTAVLAAGALVARVTGLLRWVAAAFAMGATASRLADSYQFANTAPNQLYELALGGILTSVLVPLFVDSLANKAEREAWRDVANVFWTSLVAGTVASVALVFAAPLVLRITASGLEGRDFDLAVTLLRMFAFQILFYALNALCGAVLNARRHFAVPAFTPVLNNLITIAVYLWFAAELAGPPTTDLSTGLVWLLGFGTTAGVAAMALANLPALRHRAHLRPYINLRAPILRRLLSLSVWTVLYVVTNQVGLIVIQRLASDQQGAYAAWNYALLFFQLPNGLFAVSVVTALLPSLAERWALGDLDGMKQRLGEGLRLVAFLVIPAAIALGVLSYPVIALFFGYGNFDSSDTSLVAKVLTYFAVGLVPFTLFMLALRTFYAMKDTRTPFLVNLVATAAAVPLYVLLSAPMGIYGVALGYALSYVIAAILAWLVLRRRLGKLLSGSDASAIGRILLACVPFAAVMVAVLVVNDVFNSDSSLVWYVAEVLIGTLIGLVVYIGSARFLEVDEVSHLKSLLRRRRTSDAAEQDEPSTAGEPGAGGDAPGPAS